MISAQQQSIIMISSTSIIDIVCVRMCFNQILLINIYITNCASKPIEEPSNSFNCYVKTIISTVKISSDNKENKDKSILSILRPNN